MALILDLVQNMVSALTTGETPLFQTNQCFYAFDAEASLAYPPNDQFVVVCPTNISVKERCWQGNNEINYIYNANFTLHLFTRLATDQSHQDYLWLMDQTYGSIQLVDQIVSLFQDYISADNFGYTLDGINWSPKDKSSIGWSDTLMMYHSDIIGKVGVMATSLVYYESTTGDQSPSTFGCTMESGRGNGTYYLTGVTDVSDIYTAITELLGDVQYTPGAGPLVRTLPRQHPFLPWYVAGISSMKGIGGNYQLINNPGTPFTSQFTSYALYSEYVINVDFQPRPYPIFDDVYITGTSQTWIPETSGGANTVNYTSYNEWERFCDIDAEPSSDSVTVGVGQMAFNATGLPNDAFRFTGMPKMFLNNEMLKLTWYCVPYRYYSSSNSYVRKFRGRVNKNAWNTLAFGYFDVGELLYLGCKPKKFTPPLGNNTVVLSQGVIDYAKFCNIEMTFLRTLRLLGAAPISPPTNGNYVSANHNLNPFFGSGTQALSHTFLYTSTVPTSGSSSAPLWLSGPIPECLFLDPDDGQQLGI